MRKSVDENLKAMTNDLPTTQKLSGKDSGLFCKDAYDNLKVIKVWNSKLRNPVSFIEYEQKYSLITHQLQLNKAISLKDAFKIGQYSPNVSNEISYRTAEAKTFSFYYTGATIDSISNLDIAFEGDSLSIDLRNDSIVILRLLCSKLSTKYSDKSPIDFIFKIGENRPRTNKIPFCAMFYRRQKTLNMYFLADEIGKKAIPEKEINKLVCLH